MRLTAPASARQADLGLLLLRLTTGTVLAAHGARKLFVFGFDGVSGAFAGMGVPAAAIVGPAVAMLEFFGGLALVFGLLTRVAGLALAANMLGALFLVHAPNGFFLPNGYEFVLALFGGAAALAVTGAGGFSLDALIHARARAHDARLLAPNAGLQGASGSWQRAG